MTNDDKRTQESLTNEEQGIDPTRRRFLKNTGIAIGGIAGGSLLGGVFANQFGDEDESDSKNGDFESTSTEARMFFTRYEDFLILEQATERIYPKDDNGPGAIELGVPYFIDKQLASSWGINGDDYRVGPFPKGSPTTEHSRQTRGEIFLLGLRTMNKLSQNRFNTTFNEVEEEKQIEILQDFESDDIELKGVSSGSFFELLKITTLEGVYADPLYGGNRNMEGWKMKEFPGAVTSYADIIDKDEFVKKEPVSLTNYQQKS